MGNRSYLLTKSTEATAWMPSLEANNTLPLAWLMLIADADLESARKKVGSVQDPSMRLADGPSVGVALNAAHALARAGRRSERVSAWLGAPAGEVVQQFVAHLAATSEPDLYLDLSEWFDEHANHEEGWQWLRETIATLDAPPKRGARSGSVPRAAAQLFKGLELKSADHALPWFGQGMAGMACKGIEAWRRYPPRPQRNAEDQLIWSLDGSGERCLISADGETMVILAKNSQDLAMPIIRSASGQYARLPIDGSIGRFWMTALSANGKVLIGTYEHDYLEKQGAYRYTAESGFETLLVNEKSFIEVGCSADGNTVVGYIYGSDAEKYDELLPALWRGGNGMVISLPGPSPWGKASLASADGSLVVGVWQGPRHNHPFVWSEASGVVDLGGDFNALAWRALSPDGRAGIFTANSVDQKTRMNYHWTWDGGVRRCDDAQGEPMKEAYHCSSRADTVVSTTRSAEDPTAHTAQVWTTDGTCTEVDLGSGWSGLGLERVGPRGRWFCFVATRDEQRQWYLWRAGQPLQMQAGPEGIGAASFNISASSDPEQPEDLVLFCKCAWPDGHTRLTLKAQERLPFDPAEID